MAQREEGSKRIESSVCLASTTRAIRENSIDRSFTNPLLITVPSAWSIAISMMKLVLLLIWWMVVECRLRSLSLKYWLNRRGLGRAHKTYIPRSMVGDTEEEG
jgi:hypothetical protein